RRGMDHWTVLSPDGRVLAVEEGQRRSKRGKDYVRGRSGCVEPAHRPGGEVTPHFGRGQESYYLPRRVVIRLLLAFVRPSRGRCPATRSTIRDSNHAPLNGFQPLSPAPSTVEVLRRLGPVFRAKKLPARLSHQFRMSPTGGRNGGSSLPRKAEPIDYPRRPPT